MQQVSEHKKISRIVQDQKFSPNHNLLALNFVGVTFFCCWLKPFYGKLLKRKTKNWWKSFDWVVRMCVHAYDVQISEIFHANELYVEHTHLCKHWKIGAKRAQWKCSLKAPPLDLTVYFLEFLRILDALTNLIIA